MSTPLAACLDKLLRREDLTSDEAAAAMGVVMRGDALPSHLAAFLVGLSMKGEQPQELVGLARAMRAHAVPLQRPAMRAFDTCGTGGDRSGTFNISTAAALTVAACGVTVAKHGNRSVSSHCGSADVLEALGVDISAPPAVVERCLHDVGMAFFFAPAFHPATKHAVSVRKELGVRTAFNLLGPLTNPATVTRQLVGVPRPELTELLARALLLLGSERAWVVHGAGGLDELSTTGHSKVSECRDGVVRTFYIHPADVGLRKSSLATLAGGSAMDNAARIREVLAGSEGPARDVVLLNAGASLLIAGVAESVSEGVIRAARALDSGAAADLLARLVAVSHGQDTTRAHGERRPGGVS